MKTLLPSALYWAQFNRFQLRLPGEAVNDVAQSGDNGPAVQKWAPRVRNEWPERATPDAIRAELNEYGAWDAEELADDAANWGRLLWLAAHNISDDDKPDCGSSVDEAKALRKPDGRWRLSREFTGHAKARHVLRFCDEYVRDFPTLVQARAGRRVARLAWLRALKHGDAPLENMRKAVSEL